MSDWKEYRLGDIADFNYGSMPKKEKLGKGEFPTFSGYKYQYKYPEFNCQKGNVVVVARGVGGTGDVKIVKEKCYLTNLSILIKLNNNIINNQYFYYLYLPNTLRYLDSGSAQSQITISDLRDIKLSIPNLPTQTAIAEILSSLDDKIELNNKINQKLETLAQTLFKQWFIDFEFPNKNGEPYKSSGGEMVDSELGEIPKGWEVVTIDDVTEIVTKGTTPTTIGGRFTEKGINFIKVESLTESGAFIKSKFAHIDDETNQLLKRSVIKKGDVLFSIAGTIGRVAVITNEILPANTNQAIAIIRPNKISSYFLKILMQSSLIQNDTQSNIVQAVQANLSLSVIKSTKFILPLNNILSMIDIQLNNIYDNINLLTNENENLTTLRDTLLPKLISGELEINEIKN
jgi:type I restriction enzyme S subunit